MALLWAAGFLWLAYDVAGTASPTDSNDVNAEQQTGGTDAPISGDDAKKLSEALNSF